MAAGTTCSAAKKANIRTLRAMILVDMIGERDAVFQREANSTAWLKDIIWGAAKALGHGRRSSTWRPDR